MSQNLKLGVGIASAVLAGVGTGTWLLYQHYYGRYRQCDEPPLIRGCATTGCVSSMNDNMIQFLTQCTKEHGSIFTLKLNNEYKTFIMDLKLLREFMLSKHSNFEETSRISKMRFGLTPIANDKNGIDLFTKRLQYHFKTTKNLQIISTGIYHASRKHLFAALSILNHANNSKTKPSVPTGLGVSCSTDSPLEFTIQSLYQWVYKLMFQIDISVFLLNDWHCNYDCSNKRYKQILTTINDEFFPLFVKFSQLIPLRFASQDKAKLNGFEEMDKNILTKLNQIISMVHSIADTQSNKSNYDYDVDSKYLSVTNDVCNEIELLKNDNNLKEITQGRLLLSLLWASHGNSTNTLFWFIIRMMKESQANSKVFQTIKKEINESKLFEFDCEVSDEKLNDVNFAKIGILLPTLKAFMYEIYRYYNASNIYRKITQDFKIQDPISNKTYRIRKGMMFI